MQQRTLILTLGEIARTAEQGRFRISSFSRPMVWGPKQIAAFFDSVYQGFPVGMLMVAEEPAQAEDVDLGGLIVHAPDDSKAWTIIDGVQRLSTIIGAWQARDNSRYALCFDLERRAFVPGTATHLLMLPIPVAVHPNLLRAWLTERPFLSEEQRGEAIGLGSRLASYEIPMFVMANLKDRTVSHELFTRINRGGAQLSQADVDRGRLRPRERSFGLAQVMRRTAALGFGQLTHQSATQCVLAVLKPHADIPSSASTLLRKYREISPETRREAEQAALEALGVTVSFLQRECRIPHARLLPVEATIPVLARFVHAFGRPGVRERELLRRWVWRAGGRLAEDVAMGAMARTPTKEAERLLNSLPVRGKLNYQPDRFGTDIEYPEGRMNALGMLGAQPMLIAPTGQFRELQGAPLADSQILTPWLDDGGEVFTPLLPLDLVSDATIGCFVLHPRVPPMDLLRAILNLPSGSEVLDGHFIDQYGLALLRKERFEEFSADREATLEKAIRRRVQSFARWGFRDAGRLPTLNDITGDSNGRSDD
ncbi:DUF262 domain-containing protein [Streptomyces sp. NPDC058231]|uniref:GmrSD restriction endonuclease domain-containing protein n=1 Tax=Streptomyces sp. NPDC058231 TaxID=3346392 RepID=UPI0036ECCAAA